MTNIKERVLQIAKNKGVSYEKFFKDLGLSYSNFKGYQKKSGLNSDSIVIILTKYPETDLHWLVTGESKKAENFTLNEAQEPYGDNCKKCKALEILLESKNETINAQKDTIDALKQKIEIVSGKTENSKAS